MNLLPSSLTRHSAVWFVALVLHVVGDLAAMLATFMPMKTILILASGDVPGFFPQFLVDGGAVVASLVLLLVAAACGVAAWLTGVAIEQLDGAHTAHETAQGKTIDRRSNLVREAKKDRTFESSLVLTVPVIGVIVLVSPPYLGVTGLWLLGSAAGVLWFTRRARAATPYFSGADQFSYSLATWLKDSTLWSMVGVALITLLVAPPALGSTAILIAAIFGRRLTIAIAELVPRATLVASHRASTLAQPAVAGIFTNKPTAQTVKWPIEYFSSKPGSRRLGEYLDQRGYRRADFVVLGSGFPGTLSLLCGPTRNVQRLLRIFPLQQRASRDIELRRRNESGGGGVFPAVVATETNVAGFHTLEVVLDTVDERVDVEVAPTRDQMALFQIERELDSVREFQGHSLSVDRGFDTAELVDALDRVMRIPGAHIGPCRALRRQIQEAGSQIDALPLALVPASPLAVHDCYISHTGQMRYLGGHQWSLGRPGDAWRPVNVYEKALGTVREGGGLAESLDHHAMLLNAEIHELQVVLSRFQLSQAVGTCQAVINRLDTRG